MFKFMSEKSNNDVSFEVMKEANKLFTGMLNDTFEEVLKVNNQNEVYIGQLNRILTYNINLAK